MIDQSSTELPSSAQLKLWKWSLAKKIVDGANTDRQQLLRQLQAGMCTFQQGNEDNVDGLFDSSEEAMNDDH